MYDFKVLNNGLRIVGQKMPGLKSVAVGVFVRSGSVNEIGDKEAGISHFIEHMLFKGTEQRTAKQIAQEMDSMGGILNAFTSKEVTCYHIRISTDFLPQAFVLLTDIVRYSTIPEKELETEKGVVIEEINMSHDMPEDLVHDLLAKAYFGNHPLGKPILGTKESVAAFTVQDLRSYMERRYTADKIVISIAGGYDFSAVCDMVERLWGDFPGSDEPAEGAAVSQVGITPLVIQTKPIEQVHICFAMPAYPFDAEQVYPLAVFNNLFGGGMSSRLFQSIREERGLAYDIYSHSSSYTSCGTFGIYTGVSIAKAGESIALILDEMEHMIKDGMDKEEFLRAQKQLRGNYVLALESTSSRMNAIGRTTVMNGRLYTPEESIARIDKVTIDDVASVIPHVLDRSKMSVSVVGNVEQALIEKYIQ